MTSRIGSFRLIFAIREISDQVKAGSFFRITVGDDTKFSKIPFKEALVIDLNGVGSEAIIEFTLESDTGEIFGYSELALPVEIFDKQETEVNETIKLYLNTEGDANSATAKVYLVFLNKTLFKDQRNKQKASQPVSNNLSTPQPSKQVTKTATTEEKDLLQTNSGQFNSSLKVESNKKVNKTPPPNERINKHLAPVHGHKTSNKSPSPGIRSVPGPSPNKSGTLGRSKSKSEENFSQYLNQLVEKHTHEIEKLSETTKKPESNIISPKKDLNSTQKLAEAFENNPKSNESTVSFSPEKSRKFESNQLLQYQSEQKVERPDSPSRRVIEPQLSLDKANATIYQQKSEIEHLKNIIHNLDARLKTYDLIKNENEIYRSNLAKAEESRKDLQNSILETTNELKQEQAAQHRQLNDVLREKEALVVRNEELLMKIDELNQRMIKIQTSLDKKTADNKEMEFKITQVENMEKHIERLENSLNISETKRNEDQVNFLNTLKNFEKSIEDSKLLLGTYAQEKKELVKEINELKATLAKEQAEQTDTQRAYSLTLKRLENAEKQKEVIKSLQDQREDYKRQINDSQAYQNDLKALVESTKEELMIKTRDFDNNERKYLKEIAALREKISQSEIRDNNHIHQAQIAKATISELKANVSGLEQILCIKEDVNKQLDATTVKLANTIKDRESLSNQVQALLQSQNLSNSKILDLEKEIVNLKNVITEKDEYILSLKKLIIDIKEKQVQYIPKKDDKIDIALADFVNASSDPGLLRALLIRETEGVYQFGTKKIYVKLESEKLYGIVRVGGGYVIIDEFLDQFLPVELEKIGKGDPVKLLSQKVSLEKSMVKGRSGSQTFSPVNKK